jgi:hypothetical protein
MMEELTIIDIIAIIVLAIYWYVVILFCYITRQTEKKIKEAKIRWDKEKTGG